MPYTIVVTDNEADLLTKADAGVVVNGNVITYSPSETMKIIEALNTTADADAPGLDRIRDRLATLYGQAIVARKGASVDASAATVAYGEQLPADKLEDEPYVDVVDPSPLSAPAVPSKRLRRD